MGCSSCGGRKSAASLSAAGAPATAYRATFDDGSTRTFFTKLEAERAVRKAGGGRITGVASTTPAS